MKPLVRLTASSWTCGEGTCWHDSLTLTLPDGHEQDVSDLSTEALAELICQALGADFEYSYNDSGGVGQPSWGEET